ncbi:hypothetical protein GCM10027290_64490 [Micromonospora sonneratiae]
MYSRILRLRHVNPGGLLRFIYFEGAVFLGVLLGLAELMSWWGVLILPVVVAALVKINDEVAAAIARSASRVPEVEQDRFRREITPAVGRAAVPGMTVARPAPVLRPAGPGPIGTPVTRSGPADSRTVDLSPAGPQAVPAGRTGAAVGGQPGARRDRIGAAWGWRRPVLALSSADRLPQVRQRPRPLRQWPEHGEQPDRRHRLVHQPAKRRYR